MKSTTSSPLLTSRSIFVIVFLLCIAVARAAEIDSRFDPGSASLARTWQNLKGNLPHERIPDDSEKIKDPGSWAKDYGISIVKLVGPGFVIAILTLLIGIIYGLFKLIRLCCCHLCKSEDEEESEESETDSEEMLFTHHKQWLPTAFYAVFWVFVLTGMIFGILNNPRFTDGVHDMGDSVVSVGVDAVALGQGLIDYVHGIAALLPASITQLLNQFAGVGPLADSVTVLSDNIEATSTQVNSITNKIAVIDAGNTSVVSQLYNQLADINNSSQRIISQMADLTNEIATNLRNTLNSTIGGLESQMTEIDDTVDELLGTAQDVMDQATDLVHTVNDYVDDGKSYDKSRAAAVMALFIVVIVVTFAIVLGYILKIKVIFNVIAALGFVFLFLLWFSGSLHFLLGMALYDACPVMDVAVRGLLPSDSSAADVLMGCLYEDRTVLDSMNITAYNLSEVFDYKKEFQAFASFSETFNFTEVDSYFDSIDSLYTYNLTAVALNITAASFGWNQSYVYEGLDALNNQTYLDYFILSNYSNVNPNNYTYPRNQSVYEAKVAIDGLVALNSTVYNKTSLAQKQLLAAQRDIDGLLYNMTLLRARYNYTKDSVNQLETKNISNCIGILNNLESNITAFFKLGNCSFLGETYTEIRVSLCETMQPAIDLLTVAQFLAGVALIPMVILAEVLSKRIPKCSIRILPCGDGESGSYGSSRVMHGGGGGGGGDYAMAEMESPVVHRKSAGLTATIGTSADSATSSPDYNANRRIVGDRHSGTYE